MDIAAVLKPQTQATEGSLFSVVTQQIYIFYFWKDTDIFNDNSGFESLWKHLTNCFDALWLSSTFVRSTLGPDVTKCHWTGRESVLILTDEGTFSGVLFHIFYCQQGVEEPCLFYICNCARPRYQLVSYISVLLYLVRETILLSAIIFRKGSCNNRRWRSVHAHSVKVCKRVFWMRLCL